MGLTDKQYYDNSSNWGSHQFVKLSDIINNFYAFYVGDDKIINDISRYDVVFHAKRGLQELHYDALNDIRALELEVGDDLQTELPKDFVRLVKVSWVDERGRLRPMISDKNTRTADAYLQDDNFDIIFDDQGTAINGTSIIDTRLSGVNDQEGDANDYLNKADEFFGGRYGLDTSSSNVNGKYNIDKNSGYIRFSSSINARTVVVEYVTDGLDNLTEAELQVNKLAEDFLYKYIANQVIQYKHNIQEYIVRRFKNESFAAMKNMKIRMMDIHPLDLTQALKGRNKWIK